MYVLDAEGHILAASGKAVPIEQAAPDASIAHVFPVPDLIARIKAGRTGILETKLQGLPIVLAFDDVAQWDWNVVAVADPAVLFKADPQSSKP